jgi:hypothetical protein
MNEVAPLVFEAIEVTVKRVTEEADYFNGWVVALGGRDLDADSLTIMLEDNFDEGDADYGFDTYCVVYGAQRGTVYGGVHAARVRDGSVMFEMVTAKAAQLGLPPYFRVDFPAQRADDLRKGLIAVLGPTRVE